MAPDQLFDISGTLALAGFAILILAPRRWALLNAVPYLIIPGIISALYAVLVLQHFADAGGGYGSLADVRQLLSSEWMLLAGWVHYLAFDLFVAAWLAHWMDRHGVNRIVQAPVLVTTLYFGPVGLVLGLCLIGSVRLLGQARMSADPAQST